MSNNFKSLLFMITTIFCSLMVVSIILELMLRVLPLKSIEFQAGMFDKDINLYVYEPNSRIIRTNIRGERIIRDVNSAGFLDIDHSLEKPEGVYRIGFFGDSYVEAKQVLLNDTFYRRIERKLADQHVEILAFGNSGWGTIHSYLVSKKFSEYFNIDLVVYIFSENDLGDQIYEVKNAESMPYPYLTDDNKIKIDNSKAKEYAKKREQKAVLEYIYRKSFLVQNIYRRINLLIKYGVKTSVDDDDMKMSSKTLEGIYPNPNDLPSIWPEEIKRKAMVMAEKMISRWKDEISDAGKDYVIMYIPREGEWNKPDMVQDSWKFWLKMFCERERIDFLDPTPYFIKYDNIGKKIYDDHLSIAGHKASSESFIDWFINRAKRAKINKDSN